MYVCIFFHCQCHDLTFNLVINNRDGTTATDSQAVSVQSYATGLLHWLLGGWSIMVHIHLGTKLSIILPFQNFKFVVAFNYYYKNISKKHLIIFNTGDLGQLPSCGGTELTYISRKTIKHHSS